MIYRCVTHHVVRHQKRGYNVRVLGQDRYLVQEASIRFVDVHFRGTCFEIDHPILLSIQPFLLRV